ncbi:MAG TPA: outer membrane lipoprotein-sorting protein [Acidobacteriota bacterium]|nr:outer membrane lipoprotein-sorting protein [Acidobacteriota bacterium]
MKKGVCLAIAFFFAAGLGMLWAQEKKIDAREIVEKIDELYRSDSSKALMEMEIVTPHWQRTLKMRVWSEGMDKTFIRILEPKKERGMGTLRMENEMWNYLPKTNKVIKIPPSMMMSSYMGSDFTNNDLVREYTFTEDYDFNLTQVDNPEPDLIYVKCVPHEGLPIVWGHIILAVRSEDYLPVWQKYYDEKGELVREMFFKDIKLFEDRWIPSVMELIPFTKEGHRTLIRYIEVKFDLQIDSSIFTLRNLRSGI